MDDRELARKLRRAPSLDVEHVRGVIAFFEVTRDNPRMAMSEELAALELVAQRAAETSAALKALGWYGAEALAGTLPAAESLSNLGRQLEAIERSARAARDELGESCQAGRPVGNLTHMIQMLADLIDRGGGQADATQGGELCQAFGVVIEALGLSVANHRETVRAALRRRDAKQ